MIRRHHLCVLIVLALTAACGDDDGVADTGSDSSSDSSIDTGTTDTGTTDTGATDTGTTDTGTTDTGTTDTGTTDATIDAGPPCEGNILGFCTAAGTECLGCPAGGPLSNYLCTTACRSDRDCTTRTRPVCNQPRRGVDGICTSEEFGCAWGAICASPDTPIATPDGDRPISELRQGDLVYSVEGEQIVAVPIALTGRTAVQGHHVMQVTLDSGDVLEISGGHPTADGALFADLQAGDELGELRVVHVAVIAYEFPHTYDILPASESGTYFAAGALIGSTLAP